MEAGVPQDRDSLVEGKLTKALRKSQKMLPAALQPQISRPALAGPQLCSAEPLRNFPLKDPVNMQQIEKMRGYNKPQVAETL